MGYSISARFPPMIGRLIYYIGAVTLGIGAPLFEIAIQHAGQYPLTPVEAIALAIVVEIALPVLLLAIYRVTGRIMDVAILVVTVFCVIRVLQRSLLDSVGFLEKAAFIAVTTALIALAIFRFPKLVRQWLMFCACLAPVLVSAFLYQVWMQPPWIGSAPSGPGKAPIVLIVLDEFSIYTLLDEQGRINAEIFPNFAKLQAASIWFRNTTTNHPYTAQSFSSFLSGKSIVDTVLPADSAVARQLSDAGFRTNIASPVFGCVAESNCRSRAADDFSLTNPVAILRMFASYVVPFIVQPTMLPSIVLNVIDEEAQHPESIIATSGPGQFYLLHTMLTHSPPLYGSDGRLHDLPWRTAFLPFFGSYSPFDARARSMIREQARYADIWLGRMVGTLQAKGVWDRAIVIVMADHGSCHIDGCHRTMPEEIRRPTAGLFFVPFFLHGPGLVPHVSDSPVALVDIAPTLMHVIGAPAKSGSFEGLDLLAGEPPFDRQRWAYFVTQAPKTMVALPSIRPSDGDVRYVRQPLSTFVPQ